jgi:hypothetical protein
VQNREIYFPVFNDKHDIRVLREIPADLAQADLHPASGGKPKLEKSIFSAPANVFLIEEFIGRMTKAQSPQSGSASGFPV